MAVSDKKRLQIKIDKDLDQNVEMIFNQLGLNPTVVITALYKRVEAEGRIPFDFGLTRQEQADLALIRAAEAYKAPVISGKQAVRDYLLEDDDDEY